MKHAFRRLPNASAAKWTRKVRSRTPTELGLVGATWAPTVAYTTNAAV
jgi:hypothetical protein